MNYGDLKIGMILSNDGKYSIPLYHDSGCTDPTDHSIPPGELIGQIVELNAGSQTVTFTDPSQTHNFQGASGNITDSATIPEKVISFSLSWVLNDVRPGAGVKFKDLRANVSDAQIQDAQAVLDANNVSAGLQPYIKEVAKDIGEDVSAGLSGLGGSLWMWGLLGGGIFLLSRSKTVKNL